MSKSNSKAAIAIRERANDRLVSISKYDRSKEDKDIAMERVVMEMTRAIRELDNGL